MLLRRKLLLCLISFLGSYFVIPHAGLTAVKLEKILQFSKIDEAQNYAKSLYEKHNGDRKAIAKELMSMGFDCARSKDKDKSENYAYECRYIYCENRIRVGWRSISFEFSSWSIDQTSARGTVIRYPFTCPSEAVLKARMRWIFEQKPNMVEVLND